MKLVEYLMQVDPPAAITHFLQQWQLAPLVDLFPQIKKILAPHNLMDIVVESKSGNSIACLDLFRVKYEEHWTDHPPQPTQANMQFDGGRPTHLEYYVMESKIAKMLQPSKFSFFLHKSPGCFLLKIDLEP